ncbi:hypothetical protein F2Q69_00052154 [Brassica cretica]|uniref:RecA family profile 1 domain-containing protein n=1 Tax=Brassica cretica TaxID=69181 RepID=A0A8S9MUM0_BRACR|nr:hypothetical protein F2Q69_00052154 [Brassica cretica]
MAGILRNASLLRRSLFSSEVFTRAVVGTSSQHRGFAAKVKALILFLFEAKKKSKSDGNASSEEGMSKKEIALQQALDQITSSFGKGSIMWLGRAVSPRDVPVYSTGSF